MIPDLNTPSNNSFQINLKKKIPVTQIFLGKLQKLSKMFTVNYSHWVCNPNRHLGQHKSCAELGCCKSAISASG